MEKSNRTPTPAASEGNYKPFEDDLKRGKGVDADQPHRVGYRKLVRA